MCRNLEYLSISDPNDFSVLFLQQPPSRGCCFYLVGVSVGLKGISRVMPLPAPLLGDSSRIEGSRDSHAPTRVFCFGA